MTLPIRVGVRLYFSRGYDRLLFTLNPIRGCKSNAIAFSPVPVYLLLFCGSLFCFFGSGFIFGCSACVFCACFRLWCTGCCVRMFFVCFLLLYGGYGGYFV